MDYNELYEKYNELMEENKRLRIENNNFREKLELPLLTYGISDDVSVSKDIKDSLPVQSTELKHITNISTPQDKIKLYMSLFRGREDVYAKRWQSKEGKSGYSPVCLNEWAKGVCNKPKVKCSGCTNRNYAVLDSVSIDKHLRGKAVLGVYPMLTDETCYFLAMGPMHGSFSKIKLVPHQPESSVRYC